MATNDQEARWKELSAKVTSLWSEGRCEEAAQAAEELVRTAEALFGLERHHVATWLAVLAELCAIQDRYERVVPLLERAVSILKQSSQDPRDFIGALQNLAEAYWVQGNYVRAESCYQRTLEEWERCREALHKPAERSGDAAADQTDEGRTICCLRLIGIYCLQERFAEAESLYRRLIKIHEPWTPDFRYMVLAVAMHSSVTSRTKIKPTHSALSTLRLERAVAVGQEVIEVCERHCGSDHPKLARPLIDLAQHLFWADRNTEAESLMEKALAICEQAAEPDCFQVERLCQLYPAFLREIGRAQDAEAIEARAKRLREQP
ncbi:MAG: tetratricopeptide repeat protein [Candidatus Omnitrophica bacterium]|nr:tetratricopeptide repeat protein [Candidatus Omnitrophota bacterium]